MYFLDWFQRGDYEYMFSTTAVSWTRAREICEWNGSDLTSITSQAEQEFINSHLQSLR